MKKIEKQINAKILELTNLLDEANDKGIWIRNVLIERNYKPNPKTPWLFRIEQLLLKEGKNDQGTRKA